MGRGTADRSRSGGSGRAPIIEEYAHLAPMYDKRWSFYVEATVRETEARLKMEENDRVLDLGCGTGVLLARLAAAYPKAELFGVDLVPEMLAVARRRLPSGVELRECSACQLPFGDGRFDVVLSCNMFHYLRRPVAALQEIHRVLRPSGRLLLTDWCHDYIACRLCDWWLRLLHRAHFRTYGSRECRRLLEEAGFRDPVVDRYRISWLWGLMTARARKPEAVSTKCHA